MYFNHPIYKFNNNYNRINIPMNTLNNGNSIINNINVSHNHNLNPFNNSNNMNNLYKMNINKNNNYIIIVYFIYNNSKNLFPLKVNIKEKISTLIEAYKNNAKVYDQNLVFYFNYKVLNPNLSVEQAGLQQNSIISVKKNDNYNGKVDECLYLPHNTNTDIIPECLISSKGTDNTNDPRSQPEKIINIKFIKQPGINSFILYSNPELNGILKLSLLKEISSKLNNVQISKLPDIVAYIMKILKNGYSNTPDMKKNIKDILEKMKGSNIMCFSRYVNEIININELNTITALLRNDELNEINDIKNRLSKYNEHAKQFEREFEIAKRNSIFEFSIISLVIIEREDYIRFENGKNNCPNRVDRILFHGTSIEPIASILTGYFRKSIDKGLVFGKGVYFTDLLDYCWFYGGAGGNRENANTIPEINKTFTLIACSTYYNQKGFRRVYDNKYTPKKNEINFAYAGSQTEALANPDRSKFYGTEYVIWDLDQICPFISAKLERQEYCFIWRDTNFSLKPIHFNQFDETFKKFLKERIKYIEQTAKFNIYPCETTEEALKLIRRKKYNKIILISNAGDGGREYISEARKIIGNEVIALFVAYLEDHLKWIKDFQNAIFCNESIYYEKYIECFNDPNTNNVKRNIEALISSIENRYKVRFNFNSKYLDFPYYKGSGFYSELTF